VASISQVVPASGGPVILHRVGVVNLETLASADARRAGTAFPAAAGHRQVAPLGMPPVARAARPSATAPATAGLTGFAPGNVAGERGFDGITAAIDSGANPAAGGISPPDQGLAVGPSPAGTVIEEFVNNTLNIYSPSGETLLGAIPSDQVFLLPTRYFPTDPRAYWDPQTGHWFLTQFTFGVVTSGKPTSQADQYIAVSQTASPFSNYTVFSFSTADRSTPGCPCFGDFDQVGADNSGFFIATNEFSQFSQTQQDFNGSIVYAVSKSGLIAAAQFTRPVPVIQRYRVPSDPFGAYHLSPSTVTQGSRAPDTEYFVESNAFALTGSDLRVYALLHTDSLNTGGRPPLVVTTTGTEQYSFPPDVFQKSGPFPYGQSLGQTGVGQLQTDTDAVQGVTDASGRLYAELSTGFDFGTGQNAGIGWFVLHPVTGSDSVSASLVSQGYVQTKQDLLYPVIGVNADGHGYLNFAVSAASRYPSTGYIVFNGANGPTGNIYISGHGTNALDDFDCYPPFSNGYCRYGDYSMAQDYNGKIYMASEYMAPQPRAVPVNWGTRIWYAPVP